MTSLTDQYARYIMFEFCPFGNLHTKEVLSKIENQLEIIYENYEEILPELFYNSVHSPLTTINYLEEQDIRHLEVTPKLDFIDRMNLEETFKFNLLSLCKVLLGHDNIDDEELNTVYGLHGSYFTYILEHTVLLEHLPGIIIKFMIVKSNGFDDFNDIDNNKYVINGSCLYTSQRKEFESTEETNYKSYTNRDNSYQYHSIEFKKMDPLKLIRFALNNKDVLRDTLDLYDYEVAKKLTQKQKNTLQGFIQEQKERNHKLFQSSKDGVYPLINKDIVNIINEYMYYELDEEKLVEQIIKSSEEHYNYLNSLTILDENTVIKSIKQLLHNHTVIRQKYNNSQAEMKSISYIYLFINETDVGKDLIKNNPQFGTITENKRKELIEQAKRTKNSEWFIKILTN